MARVTGALPFECPTCHGLGFTQSSAPEMQTQFRREHGEVEVKTLKQGSGCPRCLGVGQLDHEATS